MKKLLVCLFFLPFLSGNLYPQDHIFNLEILESLNNQDTYAIDYYLTQKGFRIVETLEYMDEGGVLLTSWIYSYERDSPIQAAPQAAPSGKPGNIQDNRTGRQESAKLADNDLATTGNDQTSDVDKQSERSTLQMSAGSSSISKMNMGRFMVSSEKEGSGRVVNLNYDFSDPNFFSNFQQDLRYSGYYEYEPAEEENKIWYTFTKGSIRIFLGIDLTNQQYPYRLFIEEID